MQSPDYVPPEYGADAFNCPYCGAFAHQNWHSALPQGLVDTTNTGTMFSRCSRCRNFAIWNKKILVFPTNTSAPLPTSNTPDDVKEDFLEARQIVNHSPRAAAALLRLAIEKLLRNHLGQEKANDINAAIGNLVKQGLPPKTQMALDAVRVIGNEAVHPGVLDLRDDAEIASALFRLVNIIINSMINEPQEAEDIYESLPQGKKDQIAKRDTNSP